MLTNYKDMIRCSVFLRAKEVEDVLTETKVERNREIDYCAKRFESLMKNCYIDI